MCSAKSGPQWHLIGQVFDPWTSPYGANEQITMTLHNCMYRQFHRTLMGVNLSWIWFVKFVDHGEAHMGQMGWGENELRSIGLFERNPMVKLVAAGSPHKGPVKRKAFLWHHIISKSFKHSACLNMISTLDHFLLSKQHDFKVVLLIFA